MDVKLDKWHKCHVDKEILKELSKKSDLKGIQHISVFFGLLIITGTLASLPPSIKVLSTNLVNFLNSNFIISTYV